MYARHILHLFMYADIDFSEFDEDDPLAGLLSDEDDDLDAKPKPKKSSTAKKTSTPGISSQGESIQLITLESI